MEDVDPSCTTDELAHLLRGRRTHSAQLLQQLRCRPFMDIRAADVRLVWQQGTLLAAAVQLVYIYTHAWWNKSLRKRANQAAKLD